MKCISLKPDQLEMETDRVGKLLIKLSFPQLSVSIITVIIGFFSGAIIAGMNIDYFFVFTICSPIIGSASEALLNGVRIGSASLIARNFNDKNTINSVIYNGMLLTVAHLFVYIFICLIVARPFLNFYTSRNDLVETGMKYIYVNFIAIAISAFASYYFQVLQAMGEMLLTSIFSILSVPATLILNVVFIYGKCGFPKTGLFGIVFSSMIICALKLFFSLFLLRRKGYTSIIKCKFSRNEAKQIMSVGLPSMLQATLATILVSGFNMIVKSFSEEYIIVMGIFYKWNLLVQSLIPAASLMPVIGYNVSKRRNDRIERVVRQSIAYVISISMVFTLFYLVFAGPCLRLFNCPTEIISDGKLIFRILVLYIVPMCIVTIISNISISLGNGKIGMAALIVQTSVTLGGGLLLKPIGGLYSICAFTIAEFIAAAVILILINKSSGESDKLVKKALVKQYTA